MLRGFSSSELMFTFPSALVRGMLMRPGFEEPHKALWTWLGPLGAESASGFNPPALQPVSRMPAQEGGVLPHEWAGDSQPARSCTAGNHSGPACGGNGRGEG